MKSAVQAAGRPDWAAFRCQHMKDLYPLRMKPLFDPRPWGAFDLAPVYPDRKFDEKIGEAWLTGDHCQAENGPLAGRSLSELSKEYGRELVGDAAPDAQRFPLLVKFLFPHDKLSVQVHPDDEAAREAGEPWGKTECWYVVHAKPDAQIALGLRNGVTRADLARAIHDKQAENLLNWVPVQTGDMIYVAAGTVHTLGPGSILVETQQQSDATYRLYDYGRPRELHLERGLAAVREQARSGKVARSKNAEGATELVASAYFIVEKHDLREASEFSTGESGATSTHVLVAIEGCAQIECEGCQPVTLAKSDAVVVPAGLRKYRVRPQWEVEFLCSRVPSSPRPAPETQL
jgi:mannose-6-phosphate isomerase